MTGHVKTLSPLIVEIIKPIEKRLEIADAIMPGLYLLVQSSGQKSWAVRYRIGGKLLKLTLGPYPTISLVEAREATRKALSDAVKGIKSTNRSGTVSERGPTITNKWLAHADRSGEPTCFLYRHYDARGDLLYVGMTTNLRARRAHHVKRAAWANAIHQIVIEPFESRDEALAAERLAIRTEFPRFQRGWQ